MARTNRCPQILTPDRWVEYLGHHSQWNQFDDHIWWSHQAPMNELSMRTYDDEIVQCKLTVDPVIGLLVINNLSWVGQKGISKQAKLTSGLPFVHFPAQICWAQQWSARSESTRELAIKWLWMGDGRCSFWSFKSFRRDFWGCGAAKLKRQNQ